MTQALPDSAALPAAVREGLERFCNQLRDALGDALLSVVLYGGLAKNDFYSPRTSNVNVMVVLKEVTIEILDKMVAPVEEAMQTMRLAVMVLSEKDLPTSTDVFPTKFQDVQRHHCLLWGKDVLSGLSITRDHLRLRCEQEIKNLMFRLHQLYLLRAEFPEAIEGTLTRAISALLGSLAVLVELKTAKTPRSKHEIVEAAAGLGLDAQPLRDALALKRGELKPDLARLKQLYDAFMRTVRQAADLVDAL
jgi:hypothetical protein